jgi:hypothetical protein
MEEAKGKEVITIYGFLSQEAPATENLINIDFPNSRLLLDGKPVLCMPHSSGERPTNLGSVQCHPLCLLDRKGYCLVC